MLGARTHLRTYIEVVAYCSKALVFFSCFPFSTASNLAKSIYCICVRTSETDLLSINCCLHGILTCKWRKWSLRPVTDWFHSFEPSGIGRARVSVGVKCLHAMSIVWCLRVNRGPNLLSSLLLRIISRPGLVNPAETFPYIHFNSCKAITTPRNV